MIDPSFIETTASPRRPDAPRLYLLPGFIVIVAMLLLGRSFYLQVVHGSALREQAEHNRVGQVVIPAPRGIIYDRNNTQLTENISSTDFLFDPVLLPAEENDTHLVESVAALLPNISAEQIREILTATRQRQRPLVIAKAIPHEIVLQLQEEGDRIQGTRLASSLVRDYLFGHASAPILGYTSSVTQEELEKNSQLYPTDTTGKQGIEKSYDEVLRGTNGIAQTEINAAGRPQTDLGVIDPVPGDDLQLTVDIELQNFVYAVFSELDQKSRDKESKPINAAAVVMDPRSGEIWALVSYPSYDPNAFSQPSLSDQTPAYFQDSRMPLFNRAADGTYPSGSVIKPFIAAAALQEGIINKDTQILSTGGISIGPWHFPDWKSGGHGMTDVKKAIAESVNTFFYLITGGDGRQAGLGPERTVKYLNSLGWGKPTGVDLPSEAAGFLPTPEWKEEVKGEQWYIGDSYHLGIGQGDVLVTPLQIAAATAAIADGSYLRQPHFIPTDPRTTPLSISRSHIELVQAGMRQTVTGGSGRALAEIPLSLAGKTGTAQIGGTEDTHAWFTSFGPFEHPELVVTVLLERGGAGDTDAVPAAREIWSWLAEHRLN